MRIINTYLSFSNVYLFVDTESFSLNQLAMACKLYAHGLQWGTNHDTYKQNAAWLELVDINSDQVL